MKLTSLTMAAGLFAGAALAGNVNPLDVTFADGGAVEMSLSGVAGDAASGAKIMTTRSMGNCVACHEVSSLNAAFQGNVGPALDGAAGRWSEAQLRGIVSNAKMTFDGTVMPSFYKVTGYVRPGDGYTGKAAASDPLPPLLNAQEIEDVVAFLMTLKD